MPYPGWHQSNPRHYLSIEMATPQGVSVLMYARPYRSTAFRFQCRYDKLQHWKNKGLDRCWASWCSCTDFIDRNYCYGLRQRFYGLRLLGARR